jgi:tryptophan synthase beta chain
MFQAVGRCDYRGVEDDAALEAFRTLSETEGIIPALESSHAIALTKEIAAEHDTILVNLSGRGDKDMEQAAALFDLGA